MCWRHAEELAKLNTGLSIAQAQIEATFKAVADQHHQLLQMKAQPQQQQQQQPSTPCGAPELFVFGRQPTLLSATAQPADEKDADNAASLPLARDFQLKQYFFAQGHAATKDVKEQEQELEQEQEKEPTTTARRPTTEVRRPNWHDNDDGTTSDDGGTMSDGDVTPMTTIRRPTRRPRRRQHDVRSGAPDDDCTTSDPAPPTTTVRRPTWSDDDDGTTSNDEGTTSDCEVTPTTTVRRPTCGCPGMLLGTLFFSIVWMVTFVFCFCPPQLETITKRPPLSMEEEMLATSATTAPMKPPELPTSFDVPAAWPVPAIITPQHFDLNSDGTITITEFGEVVRAWYQTDEHSQIEFDELIADADLDGNKLLDNQEITEFIFDANAAATAGLDETS
jgi:hypothetical protein